MGEREYEKNRKIRRKKIQEKRRKKDNQQNREEKKGKMYVGWKDNGARGEK